MKIEDDNTLLTLLAEDNEQALKRIYEKYFSLIYTFMLKESRSEETSKDLAQDVFFKLWKIRNKLTVAQSLKSYLYSIARNTYIDHIRKAINQKVFETINDNLHILDEELNSDDQELLSELFIYAEQMPGKRKEVFKLRWIDGLSRKEIAEQMGISVVTVDIHIKKAVDFLKEKTKASKLLYILSIFLLP